MKEKCVGFRKLDMAIDWKAERDIKFTKMDLFAKEVGMDNKQKLEFIEEIKRLERELYLKKSKLASAEAMEYGITSSTLIGSGGHIDEWKKVITNLINVIGMNSKGGNSVEDVRKERNG